MGVQVTFPEKSSVGSIELSESLRYVARQPILDIRGRVHGYELLFRDGPAVAFSGDGDLATRTMLDNTVMFGLELLTSGLPAFVNCTREALVENLVCVLPSGMTVLEILEDIVPTPDLIKACCKLKSAGFRLALDDFRWKPGIEPLIEIADYIKIDFSLSKLCVREKLLSRLKGTPVALVAEKIETQEEFKQACDEGFGLIQGYYFCRPVLLENRKVPANRLSHVEILRALQGPGFDLHKLSSLVKRDASLTYRLLRLINSPVCAMRQEVRSVEEAIIAIGEDAFRRIATLAITSELNSNQPVEILRMAFVRARFCELAANLCSLDPTEQYLLGLLSLLSAMLRLPMDQIVPALPLRDEIRLALLGAPVSERCLLDWVVCNEKWDWNACDAIAEARGLNRKNLERCYRDAMNWAELALHFA